MSADLIKMLLSLGVQLLGLLVPALGSLVGGPLGWLFGLLLNWMSGKLYAWLAQLAVANGIDAEIAPLVVAAKASTSALLAEQKKPNATEAEHAAALKAFQDAHAALSHFKLH
jgi:hypothetical protein